jgi:hypothetical protein
MLFIPTVNRDTNVLDVLIERWRAWRTGRNAFGTCSRDEVARIAHDLSLTSGELRALACQGADSADLLYRRMADLGIDRTQLERGDGRIVWDMQRSCSMCASKRRCGRDFARGADAAAWRDYCPNDEVLSSLAPARQTARRVGPAAARTAAIDTDDRGRKNLTIGLTLLALAWLVLLAAPPRLTVPTATPTIATPTADAAPTLAITCLDASCLTAPQQSALRALRIVQSAVAAACSSSVTAHRLAFSTPAPDPVVLPAAGPGGCQATFSPIWTS